MKSKSVVHVKLGEKEFGLFRMGGAGLANCLFFVARGVVFAHKEGLELLRPTWERIGIGPIIRREKDKRFYFGMFRFLFSISTIYKIFKLITGKHISIDDYKGGRSGVVILSGWWNYFEEMATHWEIIREYFLRNINPIAIRDVPESFTNTIAVHVRLGDMPEEYRVPLSWTISALKKVLQIRSDVKVKVFSDGADEDLAPLLEISGVERAFYGNALADMIAMSRMQLVIGTFSTFSWWGAYFSQIPYIAPKGKNSGCAHKDVKKFCVIEEDEEVPAYFVEELKKLLK